MCDNCPAEYRHHEHGFIVLPQSGVSPESAPASLTPDQPAPNPLLDLAASLSNEPASNQS